MVLKEKYSICSPIITAENILYEVGDDLDEDDAEKYQKSLSKTLVDLKLKSGDTLYIEDLTTDF